MQLRSIALALIASINLHADSSLHVIGYRVRGGFFSNFILILNHLQFCEQTHKTPLVYWNSSSYYYDANGWNGETENVWEYYFEPLSENRYQHDYPIHSEYENPNNFSFLNPPWNYPSISQNNRDMGKKLIDTYIRIKPQTDEKIQTFIQKNFANHHTIGIHYRGTDKFTSGEARPVNMHHIIDVANGKAQEFTNPQFFVATDQQSFLEFARKHLNGRVIFYNSFRSTNNKSIHHTHSQDKKPSMAQIGEETLIDMVLLANCDFLIRTPSNLSVASLIWNPTLPDQLVV